MREENAFREVFQVDLVDDADAGRNQAEGFEGLLAPFQKLVAFAVALEFHLQVQLQSLGRSKEIHLHGVIDHQIHGHERLDDFRVAPQALHGAAHGRQVDHQGDTGEILQDNARHHEGDLFVSRFGRVPVGQRLDVLAPNFLAVAIPQDRFQHDADADGQARNLPDALLFQSGQGMKKSFAAVARVEFLQCLKLVVHHLFCHSERSAAESKNLSPLSLISARPVSF